MDDFSHDGERDLLWRFGFDGKPYRRVQPLKLLLRHACLQQALTALRSAGAPVIAVDILPDPRFRQELSALSGWPTIPQVFVKGELVGGADIVEELAATGELERKLSDALGEGYRETRDERVVQLAA